MDVGRCDYTDVIGRAESGTEAESNARSDCRVHRDLRVSLSHLRSSLRITEYALCVLRASVVNLILVFGCAHAFEDGTFDLITLDYHRDADNNVTFFGASAYLGLDDRLQEKISVQLISRDDAGEEPGFFWGIAATGRYRFGEPLSPFVGIGFSVGEPPLCSREPEDDENEAGDEDSVRVIRDGEETCLDETLFAAFGEYGIYWLINDRVFLEVSARRNYTSKDEPFDSEVKGFSFGLRY